MTQTVVNYRSGNWWNRQLSPEKQEKLLKIVILSLASILSVGFTVGVVLTLIGMLYGLTSIYFAGVMVRLMLVLAPVMCILSGIGISAMLTRYCKQLDPATVTPLISLTSHTNANHHHHGNSHLNQSSSEKKMKRYEIYCSAPTLIIVFG
ncbi:Dolichyl-diphosphooligosaccharide--protein glycosyltransferase subunit STT3A-like protein [Dinothrombium tinctorium]|uniref:Dolichyl-diphosphooligosaccharide--protein glycosyltransferase subunit STT3A-like protein n=1 Tax=Dinothrombium tinctorium TaxID=1965070 RepID=A0A3S3PWQ2_9ACAR|nr:Dolichyl-diphosphooligosaccharide--protein glycosyltransferase subunit STT3A-like protein [Dinothrombium tinctorium]